MSKDAMTLAAARRIVRAKYPDAFGWREFSISDYVVKSDAGGQVLATATRAIDAWIKAAKETP